MFTLTFLNVFGTERDVGNTVEVSSVVSSIQETQQAITNTTSGIATANSTLTKKQTREISNRRIFNDSNVESQQSASSFITANSSSKKGIINAEMPLDRQLTDVSIRGILVKLDTGNFRNHNLFSGNHSNRIGHQRSPSDIYATCKHSSFTCTAISKLHLVICSKN